jgi:flagellar motor switch protein FliN/FliY
MEQKDIDSLLSQNKKGGGANKLEKKEARPISFLGDVMLRCIVEFGRSDVTIRDILKWKVGSVIALNKEKGVALDITANNNAIGRGEAVVVNDKFGIRVTEVVSPTGSLDDLG